MNNFRFAFRQLRKTPGFSAIAIITLALAIGANTSIFSVIRAVLLRPFPYPNSDRIVVAYESDAQLPTISISFPDYVDWRRDNTVFEHLAVIRRESYNMSGLGTRPPEQISGALVTANFFNVAGLSPQLGRVFTEEEDRVGGPQLAVISDALWRRVFERDPNILGRSITFANQPFTVVGVMPPEMTLPRTVEVWFPLMRRSDSTGWQDRRNHPGLFAVGRLKRGVSVEKAQTEMSTIAKRLAQQYPDSNSKIGVNIVQLLENAVGDLRSSLVLLFCAVGAVLLIACVNLANLLSARAATRSREFAIRSAVGASRWQIIRQLLIESAVLALIGGALGIFLASWSRDLIVALAPADTPRFQHIELDRWVLGFTLVATLLTSLLFGLWPSLHSSRPDVQLALKAGEHGSSDTPRAKYARNLLVIAEIALTLVLLTAAGLVLKSFGRARALSLGFVSHGLITARVDLPGTTYPDASKLIPFTDALEKKIQTIPGVSHAAIAANPPLMVGWQTGFLAEGQEEPPPGQLPSAEITVVSNDYLSTISTTLLRGRMFDSRDQFESTQVAIIDELLASKYFPGIDPVGKQLRMQVNQEHGRQWRTIIGVVPHLKSNGYDERVITPQVYLPLTQSPQNGLVILLRTSLPPGSVESQLRTIVASLDAAQPVFEVRTMQERVEETWATPRLVTYLLTIFAGLASTLAVVGIYGVMAYNGQRRSREIGVRLALGARHRQITGMMLGEGLRLLIIGLVFGFVGAFLLVRLIRGLLFGVTPTDPVVYLAVTLLLSAAAVLACWIPSRRATRVDPMVVLRSE